MVVKVCVRLQIGRQSCVLLVGVVVLDVVRLVLVVIVVLEVVLRVCEGVGCG